jgi:prepilin-type N-terminal cleavage/methylation domain-containing protein
VTPKRNERAFTLIELLVVIAIIALLMGILMPVLGRVRKQGRAVACLGHLNQWGLVFSIYANENDGHFPDGLSLTSGKGYYTWMDRMAAYYKSEELFTCPSATRIIEHGRGIGVGKGAAYYAWGGIDPAGKAYRGSYGQNYWVGDEEEAASSRERNNHWKGIDIKHPHAIPAVADCLWIGGYPDDADTPPPSSDGFGSSGQMNRFCLNRHEGTINMVFLDWSGRKIGLKELWTLKWHRNYDAQNRWTLAGNAQQEDWPDWMASFREY